MNSNSRLNGRLCRCTALLTVSLLAACGGGGGGGGPISTPPPPAAPAPAPAPVPAPSPTPAANGNLPPQQPVSSQFNTSEFRRSDGPGLHNAATAWSSGRTGQGVTIAVVDTGVDADSPEFAGRISPLSRDILNAGRDISGSDDHGTHVALVAAAARNNSGIVGIAFDSTIMALRTDEVGSCAADSPQDAEADCSFTDSAIAAAINYASANGAKVINVSLGGTGATTQVRNAARAAADSGALIVLSAGNDGEASPDSFATLLDSSAAGGVIIVGSIDADGALSDFSNKAGTQNNHYMAALGDRICCSYENGQVYTDSEGFNYVLSGTSFAAPQVSGAAALLAQAFPNLTGREIADILLRSAFDAGATGTDIVYGRGILDIARAFQPLGTTSLAGGGEAVALGDVSGAGASAMGDALEMASLPTVVLDEYKRAFETDLAGTLRGAQVTPRLRNAIGTQQRMVSLGSEKTSLAFAIDASEPNLAPRVGYLQLDRDEAESARVLAARVATQLAPDLKVGFAYAESADGLVAHLQGQDRPAFMIAPGASGDSGSVSRTDASLALRKQLGPWGLTLSAEQGEMLSGADIQRAAEMTGHRLEGDVGSYAVALDRDFGDLDAALGLSWMAEDRTLLGGRFHDAFGVSGADTLFVDANLGWNFAPNWRLGAAMRRGQTWAREGGLVAPGSHLASTAWSFDVERRGVFSDEDSLGLRVSQPLRVENGLLNLRLPSSYSYETLLAGYDTRSLALSPHGRELMGEIAWHGPLFYGDAAASLFYRKDPGHYEALPDDKGLAVRWARRF